MLNILFSKTVGAISGGIGILILAGCIIFIAAKALLETGPLTAKECENELKQQKVPLAEIDADVEGTLRILGAWPESITINRRICVAVAGVAPKANETRLRQQLADARREARTRREAYDQAVIDAAAANRLAAGAKRAADTAEQNQAADAKDLRAKAVKARSDADAKEQI